MFDGKKTGHPRFRWALLHGLSFQTSDSSCSSADLESSAIIVHIRLVFISIITPSGEMSSGSQISAHKFAGLGWQFRSRTTRLFR